MKAPRISSLLDICKCYEQLELCEEGISFSEWVAREVTTSHIAARLQLLKSLNKDGWGSVLHKMEEILRED